MSSFDDLPKRDRNHALEDEAAQVFNVSRDTVRKMMSFSVPPGYRRTVEVRRPKLDPFIALN